MKNLLFALAALLVIFWGCSSTKNVASPNSGVATNDTVRIANDSLEYEVIITDPGFAGYLASTAYPRNYYSLSSLELRNQQLVREYNLRATNPQRYGGLYEWTINYDFDVKYGYEVNYLLYNYFLFFQNKYNQNLGVGYVRNR